MKLLLLLEPHRFLAPDRVHVTVLSWSVRSQSDGSTSSTKRKKYQCRFFSPSSARALSWLRRSSLSLSRRLAPRPTPPCCTPSAWARVRRCCSP